MVLFFFARARREAALLNVPLYWCQAADDIKGLDAHTAQERTSVLKALVRHWNIHDTAHLHTLLPTYPGQRVRLTEKLSADHRFVQEAEGTVICTVPDPDEDQDLTQRSVTLRYCPQGSWVCFDNCKTAPLAAKMASKVDDAACEALWRLTGLDPAAAYQPDDNQKPVHERLVFVSAVARSLTRMINGKKWTAKTTNTSYFSSGSDHSVIARKTMRGGVIGDMGSMNTEPDAYWSAMYVLLSRATRMEDLLIFRCPPKSFFDKGPPAYLKQFLHEVRPHIAEGRAKADVLIAKFGW